MWWDVVLKEDDKSSQCSQWEQSCESLLGLLCHLFCVQVDYRFTPRRGMSAWCEYFVEKCCKNVMCRFKFEKCHVCDTVRAWSRLFVWFCENASNVTRSEGVSVEMCEISFVRRCRKLWEPVQFRMINDLVLTVSWSVKLVRSLNVICRLNIRLPKSAIHYLLASDIIYPPEVF